jgi:hypothetical protein
VFQKEINFYKNRHMKNILTTIFSLLVGVSLFAQSTFNDANAEVRDVKGFKGVKVSTGIKLVLTQGTTEAVAISAPNQEEKDRIKTVVENGVLKIYYDYDVWKLMRGKINKNLKAYVSIVNVQKMGVSSGASLKTDGEITGDKIDIDASSGGMMQAKVKATSLTVDGSSGAVVTMSGTADNIDIDGSSGAVFQGYDLVVNTCNAGTSSGAVAQITANKEMTGKASSGGHVSFKGSANLVARRTSSGGHVGRED